MKKGQTKRLTKQHIASGGASGIFGEDAKTHDGSVHNVGKSVFLALEKKYPKYSFRFRETITKQEINKKLNSIDSRLGKTLFVQDSSIKPDGLL